MQKKSVKSEGSSGAIVEWAPFTLAPGATEAQLLDAAREIQSGFLERQPGFLRRELLRGKDGGFVDILHWRDQASVDAAMQTAMTNPACAAYFACMATTDAPAGGMLFFERVVAFS